jgi:nucleotide-binding universal stress UspA family protein
MKILICTNGSPPADQAARMGAWIASACQAEATVLGIGKRSQRDEKLQTSLKQVEEMLREQNVTAEFITRIGQPVAEIVKRTRETNYDMVVIGAERKRGGGLYAMSLLAHRIIEAIDPSVLVVIGEAKSLRKILICSGGIRAEQAARFTGEIASRVKASITLLHVMNSPPAMYADLIRTEENNVESLLASDTALGRNLSRQKQQIEELGVPCEVRIREGLVAEEIAKEACREDYDLIVTGSFPARDRLRRYVMGNITQEILDQADSPVLVVRTLAGGQGIRHRLAEWISRIWARS